MVKYYKNESQFYATFLNGQGKPIANNTEVHFNVNGVFYTSYTNENGTAKLNINLYPVLRPERRHRGQRHRRLQRGLPGPGRRRPPGDPGELEGGAGGPGALRLHPAPGDAPGAQG